MSNERKTPASDDAPRARSMSQRSDLIVCLWTEQRVDDPIMLYTAKNREVTPKETP